MKILSIETSCDETGISLLLVNKKNDFKVLGNELSSQAKMHSPYGGVFPNLAKREHIKNLPILLDKLVKKSKIDLKDIDIIAVTYGPGLEPALWTGITFAQELAKKYKKPLVPVNHMEGHIISVFGKNTGSFSIPKVKFPTLSLLVSGGHTELVLSKDFLSHKILGATLDDAAGEAFDKVARMLSLPYPGGPEISKLAKEARRIKNNFVFGSLGSHDDDEQRNFSAEKFRADRNKIIDTYPSFPRPMLKSKNYNFSFSGLKTAVLYFIRKVEPLDEEMKKAIALEFENAVIETLIYKTNKAVEEYKTKTLIVAGGVANNQFLRKEIKKNIKGVEILFPGKGLSTDNSIMIGLAGYFQYMKNPKKYTSKTKIKAIGNLKLK